MQVDFDGVATNPRVNVEISMKEFDKSLSKRDRALLPSQSLDGIISYLARKHEGNVHEKGIVTIKRSRQIWIAQMDIML
jgi:hypothetical protein